MVTDSVLGGKTIGAFMEIKTVLIDYNGVLKKTQFEQ
jgi:hypothetical protein